MVLLFMMNLFNYIKMHCYLPCLPKAPDWSSKKSNGQELGRKGIGRNDRQKEKQSQSSLGPRANQQEPASQMERKQESWTGSA